MPSKDTSGGPAAATGALPLERPRSGLGVQAQVDEGGGGDEGGVRRTLSDDGHAPLGRHDVPLQGGAVPISTRGRGCELYLFVRCI